MAKLQSGTQIFGNAIINANLTTGNVVIAGSSSNGIIFIDGTTQITNAASFNFSTQGYLQANNAASFANGAFSAANSAASFANGAFTAANVSQAIDNTQNTNISSAQSFANGAFNAANSAASFANGAFTQANNAASFANSAFTSANNLAAVNTTQNTNISSAQSFANGAFNAANSAASFANGAFTQANTRLANTGTLVTANGLSVFNFANTTAATSVTTGAVTIAGGLGVSGAVYADTFRSLNNGSGTNYYVGDDAVIGDYNTANSLRISGLQDATQGYISFGTNAATNYIGRSGANPITVTGPFQISTNSATSSVSIEGYANRGGVGYHDFLRVTNTYGSATNPNKHFRMNSSGSIELINSAYSNIILTITDTGSLIAGTNSGDYIQFGDGTRQYTANSASGSSTDTVARASAQAAFDRANSGYDQANSSASFANGAFARANSAYDYANTIAASSAQGAFDRANSAYAQANSAASFANGAFTQANNAASFANSAFTLANNTVGVDNTQNTNISSAQSYANGAFTQANNAASFANSAFTLANNTVGVNNTQNTNISSAQSYANGAFTQANNAASFANSAFTLANNTVGVDNTQNTNISSAQSFANGAFTQANNAASFANGAFARANSGYDQANSAASFANSAFTKANNALANTTGTFAGDLTITGNLFVNGTTTTVNTQTLLVGDNLIVLNSDIPTTVPAPTIDSGIEINRGLYQNTQLVWSEASTAWRMSDGNTFASIASANLTQAAFAQANNAFNVANVSYTQANNAASFANGAFTQANSAASFANGAFTAANVSQAINNTQNTNISSAQSFANGAFTQANNAASFANSAFNMANNSVITLTSNSQTQITTNTSLGNIVFGLATTGVVAGSYAYYTNWQVDAFGRITTTTASTILEPMGNSAYAFANTGYTQANNAASFANGAFSAANSAASFANGAFTAANVAFGRIQITANTGDLLANGVNTPVTGNILLGLATTSVAAGTYGGATQIPVVTIDSKGRATYAANVAFSSGVTLSDDTTTNSTHYVVLEDITSGSVTTAKVSSTKLTFNPSTGTLGATVFTSLSDENKKTNIKPIENALNIVENIKGVTFDWKESNLPSAGLIAQDVEKYLPQLIETSHDNKTLNYNGVIGILVEAIKELNKKVKHLENKE